MQASLYVRLSREASDSNLSLQGMVEETHALAERLGYSVTAEHIDDGISGAVRDRPEFLAWLDDARRGHVDALVTFHADRLTREGVNVAAMVLDVVEGKDPVTGRVVREPVRLLSVDGLDSREADSFRWRFVIAAEIARSERERIKARNLATQKRLRAAGRFKGGPIPYGTELVLRDGGKYLQANDAEATLLRTVAARLLRGDGMRTVVRWLNESGHRTRKGNDWQRTSLVGTLVSEAAREHVFDLATYRALEARLRRDPARATSRGGRPVAHLLSGGAAVCGSCGRRMTTGTARRHGEPIVRYVCSSASEGRLCPGQATIFADPLDAEIERQFLQHYGDTYALELRVRVEGGADVDAAERAQEAAQEALLTELTSENLAAAQKARERLDAARSQPTRRVREIWPSEKTYGEMWAAADVPERAAMVRAALAEPVAVRSGGSGRKGQPRGEINLDRVDIIWRDEVNPE